MNIIEKPTPAKLEELKALSVVVARSCFNIITNKHKKESDLASKIYSDLTYEYQNILSSPREVFMNPTRFFVLGEEVMYGQLDRSEVVASIDDVLYVLVVKSKESHGSETAYRVVSWHSIHKTGERPATRFAEETSINVVYSNSEVRSLLSKIYSFGVDMEPDYQRGFVWTLEQKQALIKSIFRNVDIGNFVFNQLRYHDDHYGYEIIDGKQRLTALREFLEDRFTVNNKYFSDLSFRDSRHITGFGVQFGTLHDATKAEIYELFVKMNSFGTLVDKKHVNKVNEMYLNELTK